MRGVALKAKHAGRIKKGRKRRKWIAERRIWFDLRNDVYERDEGICQVCQRPVSYPKFQVGHIVDRYMGGSDTLDNVVVMCERCNTLKPYHRSKEEYGEWFDLQKARCELSQIP
jgi:5-methylcytosine-specific restriction endonuclease McrA